MKDAQAPTTAEPVKDATTEPAKEPTAPVVPEKYDFKDIDSAIVEKATPIFKELGLSQDAAQKLVSLYSDQAKAQAEATTKLVSDMRADWLSQTEKLPEVTAKGLDHAKAELGRAKAAIFENDPKGLTAFNEAMDLTGAGDHPAIVKAIMRFAARVNEGSHVRGSAPSPEGQAAPDRSARPTAAQSLYPNLPSATH